MSIDAAWAASSSLEALLRDVVGEGIFVRVQEAFDRDVTNVMVHTTVMATRTMSDLELSQASNAVLAQIVVDLVDGLRNELRRLADQIDDGEGAS
jgi:hypothetical protein